MSAITQQQPLRIVGGCVPFSAKEVDCPVCGTEAGKNCKRGPNHVERGRAARYAWQGRQEVRELMQ